MKNNYSLLLSISIHLIFFIGMLLLLPKKKEEVVDEKINIELVIKKEEKSVKSRDVIDYSVEIVDSSDIVEVNIEHPQRDSYLGDLLESTPDLIVFENNFSENIDIEFDNFDTMDFEKNLSDFIPEKEIEEKVVADELSISWDGKKREIITNSFIDFSSFPKESFTGVGVHVEFMVNSRGEVFGVNVLPPGSGSIEFDILIGQYVAKFLFNEGDQSSRGEVFIVYKK